MIRYPESFRELVDYSLLESGGPIPESKSTIDYETFICCDPEILARLVRLALVLLVALVVVLGLFYSRVRSFAARGSRESAEPPGSGA